MKTALPQRPVLPLLLTHVADGRELRRSLVGDSMGWSYEKSAVLCGGFRTDGSPVDESALSGTVQPFTRNGAIVSIDVDSEEVNVKHYPPQTGPSASSFRPYEFQAVYGISVFRSGSPESRGVVADGSPAEGRVKVRTMAGLDLAVFAVRLGRMSRTQGRQVPGPLPTVSAQVLVYQASKRLEFKTVAATAAGLPD